MAYVFFDRTAAGRGDWDFRVVLADSDQEALVVAAENGVHIGREGDGWDMIDATEFLRLERTPLAGGEQVVILFTVAYVVMCESPGGNSSCEMVFTGEDAFERACESLTQRFGPPVECDPPEDFGRFLWSWKQRIDNQDVVMSVYWVRPTRLVKED